MTGAADLIMGRAIPATSSPVCSLPLIEAGTLHEVPQHSTECLYQYAEGKGRRAAQAPAF